jgi:cytochrome c peroxidase
VKRVALLLMGLVSIGVIFRLCSPEPGYQWQLPLNIPPPLVPVDNPMSATKVKLGRRLFYDVRLSINQSTACATCHRQSMAFTDGRPRAVGATGEIHPKNTMSLVNVAYNSRLTWANHLLDRLEVQALVPMFGVNPVEMGLSGKETALVDLLRSDFDYANLLPLAFPNDEDPFSVLHVVRAIASFVRSIVAFDSPYDQFQSGDETAMSASAQRGMALFFSESLECFHCHGGFNFTDSSTHANTTIASAGFHNTGLYSLDIDGAYPEDNRGLIELTGERRDMGRFRAPSLRNIAATAPYMHDGSIATLNAVIEHYAAGGREIGTGPLAGDGSRNPYKSVFIRQFELSDAQKEDLIVFLRALSDESVMSDPAFNDPFSLSAQ